MHAASWHELTFCDDAAALATLYSFPLRRDARLDHLLWSVEVLQNAIHANLASRAETNDRCDSDKATHGDWE